MNTILVVVGVLFGLSLLGTLVRRALVQVAGRAIGQAALDRQPDHIHLDRTGNAVWTQAAPVDALLQPLRSAGFESAGVYTVREMPEIALELLAHAGDGAIAVVYQHTRVGVWMDIACRYSDGTSFTVSTSRPSGLDARPGHPIVNLQGASADQAIEHARTLRPAGDVQPVSVHHALRRFESAYAETMAYRKAKGVSKSEVANVDREWRKAA